MDFFTEDFARPGDADFTNFPKRLPEDCVSYCIYLFSAFSTSTSTNPSSSSSTTPATLVTRLKAITTASSKLASSLLKSYIWQREAFSLALTIPEPLSPDSKSPATPHLAGRTEFGDSIADEWLIVYLLRELSAQFPDAWIRVTDADGEFPLIEAANVLPKWLTPEVAENRVWLHAGKLQIIPREMGEGGRQVARPMGLGNALQFVRTREKEMIYSPIIEEEALYRLKGYPEKIEESMHTARVTVPRKLAYVLHRTPAHISAAVDAFYLRDPISLKPLKAKSKTKLTFPPDDLVTFSVKFTRVGYAQLKSQEFTPPASWAGAILRTGDAQAQSRAEMGMKVACGFEMLIADPQNKNKRSVREIELLLDDLKSGEDELPSDAEITEWAQLDDNEKWLDVNFEDFEKELSGRKGASGEKEKAGDFGDKGAQDNLRRIVERFEQFLNDDSADADGIDLDDDMNDDTIDDDDDDSDDLDISGEDREASFDEEEFQNMMKQMMGLTAGEMLMPQQSTTGQPQGNALPSSEFPTTNRIEELDSSDDDEGEDKEDMQEIMKRMERELNEFGALDLGAPSTIRSQLADGAGSTSAYSDNTDHVEEDPKYILAKNLLESFKGQAGMSGPAGNLMNSMGFNFPRNEED